MLLSNSAEIRKADEIMIRENDFPGVILMETAGRKSAEFILEAYPHKSHYLILAGPGNNGGDGLVIARYLALAGKSVEILLSHPGEKYQGDAGINFRALKGSGIPVREYPDFHDPQKGTDLLLIDALLGTGVEDKLRGPVAEIISRFREGSWDCVAIDLPSGLDANTGFALNQPIPANYTCTFQLPKICHFTTPASEFCGEPVIIDIGIWPQVIDQLGISRRIITPSFVQDCHQTRQASSHKGTFGHAVLAGGSANMPGAIALASRAALSIGAGLSTAFIPGGAWHEMFQAGTPEVMTLTYGGREQEFLDGDAATLLMSNMSHKKALAIGPGLGNNENTLNFLKKIDFSALEAVVFDADALNLLAENEGLMEKLPENSILTPHPGEMKRLQANPDPVTHRLEAAESLARKHKSIIILKGAHTIVAMPFGGSWVNTTGNPGMATAGSGDVLTGTITGLLAQGYSPEDAALCGVYLHGLAGDLAAEALSQEGVTASSIIQYLGKALKLVLAGNAPKIHTI